MADIPVTYVYTDGNVLIPASHGRNVYSSTGDEGIYSEPNGGLESANLAAGFQAGAEHIAPEEAIVTRQDAYIGDSDYMNAAIGNDDSSLYHPVAGCALRVQLPYAVASIFWMWSYFISVWRPIKANDGTTLTGTMIITLDGAVIDHTQRRIPPTAHIRPLDGAMFSSEGLLARWVDGCHLQIGADAGFHELYLALSLQEGEFNETIARTVDGASKSYAHRFGSRVSFGVRSARCIAFL